MWKATTCALEAHVGFGRSVPTSVPERGPIPVRRHPAPTKFPTKNGPEIVKSQARSVIPGSLSKPPPSASRPPHRQGLRGSWPLPRDHARLRNNQCTRKRANTQPPAPPGARVSRRRLSGAAPEGRRAWPADPPQWRAQAPWVQDFQVERESSTRSRSTWTASSGQGVVLAGSFIVHNVPRARHVRSHASLSRPDAYLCGKLEISV
jgi:hypothetical protein